MDKARPEIPPARLSFFEKAGLIYVWSTLLLLMLGIVFQPPVEPWGQIFAPVLLLGYVPCGLALLMWCFARNRKPARKLNEPFIARVGVWDRDLDG